MNIKTKGIDNGEAHPVAIHSFLANSDRVLLRAKKRVHLAGL